MNDNGASEKATTDEVAHSALMTERLFSSSYRYAEGEAYDSLDAVVLVGDYTDEGTPKQYDAFFDVVNENLRTGTTLLACLGNHEFRNPGEDSVSNDSKFSTTYDRFEDYFGYGVDNVHVINGYTFIGFASDCKGGRGYTGSKAEWLDQQISAAAASDPTGKKPIFVFGHVPVWETCLGSIRENNYPTDDIGDVLSKYPQVVYLSGHTHAPACDPESVWQGNFTAINTGTLAYDDSPFYTGDGTTRGSYFRRDQHGGYQYVMLGKYFEHAEWYASVYTVVEVDAHNVIRLRY
jgi:predicted phosphodiesterase